MSKQSDTPRTQAMLVGRATYISLADFARSLERENAELVKSLQEISVALKQLQNAMPVAQRIGIDMLITVADEAITRATGAV